MQVTEECARRIKGDDYITAHFNFVLLYLGENKRCDFIMHFNFVFTLHFGINDRNL